MPEPMTRELYDELQLYALQNCDTGEESPEQAMKRLKPHLDALLAAHARRWYRNGLIEAKAAANYDVEKILEDKVFK